MLREAEADLARWEARLAALPPEPRSKRERAEDPHAEEREIVRRRLPLARQRCLLAVDHARTYGSLLDGDVRPLDRTVVARLASHVGLALHEGGGIAWLRELLRRADAGAHVTVERGADLYAVLARALDLASGTSEEARRLAVLTEAVEAVRAKVGEAEARELGEVLKVATATAPVVVRTAVQERAEADEVGVELFERIRKRRR